VFGRLPQLDLSTSHFSEVGVEDDLGLGSIVSQDATLKSRIIQINVTHVRGLPEARDNGGDLVLVHFASRGDI
jgi:hypothetical protein